MNIFYLDPNPMICAQYHTDKHCVKMILEYAQLLSTAHRILDGVEELVPYTPVEILYYDNKQFKGLKFGKRKVRKDLTLYHINKKMDSCVYRQTHFNHPSAIWVRSSAANYLWLFSLFNALLQEYEYRYGKKHKCNELYYYLMCLPTNIPRGEFTEPTPAMPVEYIKEGDSITSYHAYYNGNKSRMFSWKKREVPFFIN